MQFSVRINNQQAYPIITLKDKLTGCSAEIYAFGGLLNGWKIPLKGKLQQCVDGFDSVSDARKNMASSFKSAKLSPFVCRMRKGTYQLNDQSYTVHKHYLEANAIHGLVFDAPFAIKTHEATNSEASVALEYHYQQSDQGYPFNYSITIIWKLESGNKLSATTLISHENKLDIPYADGWHPYFTLGGKVNNYTLQFNSDTQLLFDKELLPTGKKKKDTRFLKGLLLNDTFLDNSFELKPNEPGKCILSNKSLKLTIEPDAAYPILQVYTPLHRKSIAIENLSGAPDNFNNGMGLLLLKPKQIYTFSTSYTIAVQ
ncbi:MAG: aldose 1-epimerase [Sphingobacteriia bacterium]|nr:MAG: aldose 1-epimerase [Sphingobacteriia bacterium]